MTQALPPPSDARGQVIALEPIVGLLNLMAREPAADDLMAAYQVRRQSGVLADVILCRATDFEEAREVPNTLAYEAAHFGVPILGR